MNKKEPQGYEALEWIRTNPNPCPLAGEMLGDRNQAMAYIQRLYDAGAEYVYVDDILDEPWRLQEMGGPYAPSFKAVLPGDPKKRKRLLQIYEADVLIPFEEENGITLQRNYDSGEITFWWD